MKTILITGASGFFGGILKQRLLEEGHRCVNIDLQPDDVEHERLTSIQGDIRDLDTMEKLFSEHKFDTVFHCAAILAHGKIDRDMLWTSNVDGTRNVAEMAKKHGVPSLVFTSTNCLWGNSLHRPVAEDDEPCPVELYGRSKLEAEKVLREYENDLNVVIIRCPTIIESGRLGLLAILFQFIDEGRRVWVVGHGDNHYQFIDAHDLAEACILGSEHDKSDVFNIGSDDVKSFREVYQYVIDRAETGARVASLPKAPTLFMMRLAHWLRISPLGPYHYRMIAEDFVFDTHKIKEALGWKPTVTNEEMLYRGYQYYHDNRDAIASRTNVSAHKQASKMGVINLLKWMS